MIKKIPSLLLIFLCLSYLGFGQTTIYSEDFTGQNGKGALGPTPIIDVSGVSWNVDVSGATLDAANDWFYVTNEYLEGRDLDGPAIWLSPLVDITGFTNVQFSLDVFENLANDNLEDADTVTIEYRIDGGVWTLSAVNDTYINDFPDSVTSTTGLAGNTFELRVTMTNNGNGERQRIDNILVEGTAPVTPTITVTPNTITGLGYVEGDASIQESTFTVQGFSLTNDIVLTAPTNFEISTTSGAGFGNTLTLTQAAGIVNLTTIYVRLISGLTTNTYSGTLTTTSIGATTQNVTLDGEVTAPIADCSELLITEYHEGLDGEERYIEIYNPTNAIIDLSNYRLARYVNQNTIPNALALTGDINPYGTYLVSGELSTLCASGEADLCTASNVMNFNGDDEMALQTSGGTNIDVIGTIGSSGNFGLNIGLIRNIDVAIPTVVYNATDWTTYAVNDSSNLGVHASECLCPNSTTWDGITWSSGIPDSTTAAIINGNYDTSTSNSFTSCNLTINSGFNLTINNGDFIEVENYVLVNDGATLTTDSTGSFIQRGDNEFANEFILKGTGNSLVNKTTSPLAYWYSLTYWSSPIADATTDIALSTSERVFWFNANNYLDANGDSLDDDANAWTREFGSFPMTPGQGFAASHTQIGFVPGNRYSYIFNGAYNTGDITYSVINTTDLTTSPATNGLHWNLIGNPYPSAIDVDAFFAENGTVAPGNNTVYEVLYMWSQVNPVDAGNVGNEVLNYNQNDYITINAISESGNGTTSPPSRQIPSGQAFFIPSASSGDVVFTNSMRVSGNGVNTEFYRTSNAQNTTNTIEKLNINLSSDIGIYSQISVAYADFATDDYDGNAIDTFRNYAGNAGVLYSLDTEGNGFYVIQGKAKSSLTENEVIKIGFGAYISTNETYTLEIVKREGDFLSTNPIYLKDNDLNIVHNLGESSYTFNSDGGSFDERFEIIFNNAALSIDDEIIAENRLSIVEFDKDNVEFSIKNNAQIIESVKIYDLQGRLVYDLEGVNNSSTEVFNLSNLNSQIYIAKVALSSGQILSKKAIKK